MIEKNLPVQVSLLSSFCSFSDLLTHIFFFFSYFFSQVVWEKKNQKRIDEMRVVFFLSPFLFPFPLFLSLPSHLFPCSPSFPFFLISSSLCLLYKQVHICSSFDEANGGFEEITFSRWV